MPPANRHKPIRAKSSTSDYSVHEFLAEFPDDNACLEYLWRTRHAADGEHAQCPKCERVTAFKRYATKQQRQSWTCTACGHHLHPTAGTIFHRSSTSLRLWFYAMHLMTSTRCGIPAKQLERELGVHYKTAWRMLNLIRDKLMVQDDEPLSGEVEVDETAWGGKPRLGEITGAPGADLSSAGGRWKQEKKKTVFAMVERGGRVRVDVVPSRRATTLQPHVIKYVL